MITLSRKLTGLAMVFIALPLYAQAPVYDADSMPPDQEMIATDQTPDYPPPPAPSAANGFPPEGETFVPMQTAMAAAASATDTVSTVRTTRVSSSAGGTVEQRLRQIEQQMGSIQANGSSVRVESLQDQVQALRNQIEIMTHQLDQLQAQQKMQFSDLEKRFGMVEAALKKPATAATAVDKAASAASSATPAPVAIKTSEKKSGKQGKQTEIVSSDSLNPLNEKSLSKPSQPNVAEEQKIYQTAYNLIKAKKYDDAVNALQGMLKRYPSGQFASNAHYWLGELYGLMGKNTLALKEFYAVVQTYPDSPRVSDAQLKVGLILASEFKWPDAKMAFKKVMDNSPGTASARLAAEQLKQIKQAGH